MSDKTRIFAVLITACAALLLLAGPIGDWIGRMNAPEEPEISTRPHELSAPIVQLKIKREPVKAPDVNAKSADQPSLPEPAASAFDAGVETR